MTTPNRTPGEGTIWSTHNSAAPAPPLPACCEIAIVGAGITGLTAALELQSRGKDVVVLEETAPAAGTTGGSSAHLTTLLDTGLSRTESIFSAADNELVLNAMANAIDQIEAWAREFEIDCGFRRVDGFYFAQDRDGADRLRKEIEAAQSAKQQVDEAAQPPLPFPVSQCFRFPNQAAFDPAAYAAGLAGAFVARGGHIFNGTRVLDYADGHSCRVDTDRGSLTADSLILATHTPLGRSLLHAELSPQRSYLIAAEVEEDPADCLAWDTASPYHYLRRVDRSDGQRPLLLLGGADHPSGHFHGGRAPYENLEFWMRERFSVRRIVRQWSAQFYEPMDGFPYVGKPLSGMNLYVSTGYGGDGLTLGTASGKLLADLVTGRKSPLHTLLSPTRIKAKAAARVACFNMKTIKHLAAPSRNDPPPRGSGQVTGDEKDGSKAMYHAADGELTTLSARCPHMGCVLQWNDLEKTWDCPCHGGRFTAQGKRIEGPPRSDMTLLEAKRGEVDAGARQ